MSKDCVMTMKEFVENWLFPIIESLPKEERDKLLEKMIVQANEEKSRQNLSVDNERIFKRVRDEVLSLPKEEKQRIKEKYENDDDSIYASPEDFEVDFPTTKEEAAYTIINMCKDCDNRYSCSGYESKKCNEKKEKIKNFFKNG